MTTSNTLEYMRDHLFWMKVIKTKNGYLTISRVYTILYTRKSYRITAVGTVPLWTTWGEDNDTSYDCMVNGEHPKNLQIMQHFIGFHVHTDRSQVIAGLWSDDSGSKSDAVQVASHLNSYPPTDESQTQ